MKPERFPVAPLWCSVPRLPIDSVSEDVSAGATERLHTRRVGFLGR
jgi:hypothetical protein